MNSVDVIDDVERAQALLSPVRLAILERLATPDSAAGLARLLDVPRQRLNYHLRELEAHGLVQLVEERRRGNATERIYRRSGDQFAIATTALGSLGSDPAQVRDRFSSAYQIALASRTVAEVGALRRGAEAAGKPLATFSLDAEVRFASPEARAGFAEALASAVAELVRDYHDESASGGRTHRILVGAYPKPGVEPGD